MTHPSPPVVAARSLRHPLGRKLAPIERTVSISLVYTAWLPELVMGDGRRTQGR